MNAVFNFQFNYYVPIGCFAIHLSTETMNKQYQQQLYEICSSSSSKATYDGLSLKKVIHFCFTITICKLLQQDCIMPKKRRFIVITYDNIALHCHGIIIVNVNQVIFQQGSKLCEITQGPTFWEIKTYLIKSYKTCKPSYLC